MTRPRLCATCHTTATHAEVETIPIATIDRAGNVHRTITRKTTFYCDEHTGLTPKETIQ
jgi:hypothetical protein